MRQPGGATTEGARDTDACRVLVVDDHPDVLESLAMLLELHGHEVATARDGLEAVDVAGRFRPDLVLLDLGMPRLDGYGACRLIREQTWGKGVRIVALTGWGQDGDRRQTEEAGFDDHLVKPVAPSALLEMVAKVKTRGA
jgi:CheY-like chemotaxis protein